MNVDNDAATKEKKIKKRIENELCGRVVAEDEDEWNVESRNVTVKPTNGQIYSFSLFISNQKNNKKMAVSCVTLLHYFQQPWSYVLRKRYQ